MKHMISFPFETSKIEHRIPILPITSAKMMEIMNETESIQLKVRDQEANETVYKVKMSIRMGKLKRSYAEQVGVDVSSLKFLLNGQRINDEDTPQTLKMEEDDLIEVFKEQTGGDDKGKVDLL